MGAASKKAQQVRQASEFDVRVLTAELERPKGSEGLIYAWTLADIMTAREAQLRGHFALPARMAEAMRTDDALFTAYQTRLAPQRCLKVALEPAKGARGKKIADEAEGLFGARGVGIHPDTIADIHGCLVNHGVAFAQCIANPRADGSRVDFELKAWPIEFVRWDPFYKIYITQVNPDTVPNGEIQPLQSGGYTYPFPGGAQVPIIHGDGRWIVFRKNEIYPWREDATLLPAAIVWARHAFAARDWAKGSVTHGNAKVVGELPAGVSLQGPNNTLSPQAKAFFDLLRAIANGDSPFGIRPSGSKTEMLVNSSTAWQVWSELVQNGERGAARIYLGTDGTLGAVGGAPGVDVDVLLGVATTKVSGDLEAIERGIQFLVEMWTAVNFGDSTLAPYRKYQLPDADEEERLESITKKRTAFYADIASARAQGFDVTQDFVDKVAEEYGLEAPTLQAITQSGPTNPLTTKDVAGVVLTVNEARASAGLGPLLLPTGVVDPRGSMTVGEFNAKAIAATDVMTPSGSPGGAPGGAPGNVGGVGPGANV